MPPRNATLVISENFPPKTGGSGRWFWELYSRLPRHEFVIAAGEDPQQLIFDRTHDLPVFRVPLTLPHWGLRNRTGLVGYYRAFRQLSSMMRSENIQYVHCGKCLPEGLLALALKYFYGTRYLCYAHGEELTFTQNSRELGWLTRQVLRRADLVIANSNNTLRLLREKWRVPAVRTRLLLPGVDTSRFSPAASSSVARRKLAWVDRRVMLTVGRLQKRKGHDMLIRALPSIVQVFPDVLYSIVGNGEERAQLEAQVRHAGLSQHVQFLGEPNDELLVRCYQQCDLFVLPNRQVGQDIEGFGMVLLEAQACGKPVIAGASGGTAETMRIPETGCVVPCDRPDDLAALVISMLNDPLRLTRMGHAGRQWAVKEFDWSNLSEKAKRIFQEMTKTPGALNARSQKHLANPAIERCSLSKA